MSFDNDSILGAFPDAEPSGEVNVNGRVGVSRRRSRGFCKESYTKGSAGSGPADV